MNIFPIADYTMSSTVDWPGNLSAVIWTQGCPNYCPYCHNPSLIPIGKPGKAEEEKLASFFVELEKRKGFLDSVVITGGEPLLAHNLMGVMQKIKGMGFKVGLHTSGLNYVNTMTEILNKPLVDWIGLDYKAPTYKYTEYSQLCVPYDILNIISSNISNFEVRTTYHSELLSVSDLGFIARALRGKTNLWVIQNCSGDHGDLKEADHVLLTQNQVSILEDILDGEIIIR